MLLVLLIVLVADADTVGILASSTTDVKDWFVGRLRVKEKQIYLNLSEEEKRLLFSRVKTAELSGNPTLNA